MVTVESVYYCNTDQNALVNSTGEMSCPDCTENAERIGWFETLVDGSLEGPDSPAIPEPFSPGESET